MSDRYLEQIINIKFRVKLEKNATDICAMLSEVCGGDGMEKTSVFEWKKCFKESSHVKITNEDNTDYLLRYLG
jgi:hypothetical protein